MDIDQQRVDAIEAVDRLRTPTDEAIKKIAASMKEVGLLNAITVRLVDEMVIDGDVIEGVPVLIAGATRLAAAKALGWERIDCLIVDCDETEARMMEIAENLHRAELTALERDEQIAQWVDLAEKRVLAQVEPKPQGGRPESGARAASRELGVDRNKAQRAKKVAGLSDEAKKTAKDEGLDNNQSAMLAAAEEDTAEGQVAFLKNRGSAQSPADDPLNDFEARERQVKSLMSAWNKATAEARQEFLGRVDRPVMDRRWSQ